MRTQVLKKVFEDLSDSGYHRHNKSGGQKPERQARTPVAYRSARSTRDTANGHVGQGSCLEDYRHGRMHSILLHT